MSLAELAFVFILVGVPLWLVARAWRRHLAVDYSAVKDLLQMRIGLTLISLTTGMWFAVFILMILEDHNAEAKALGASLSPAMIGLINLLFCAGALVCSARGLRRADKTGRLRLAIGASSGFLMLIWLFLLANTH